MAKREFSMVAYFNRLAQDWVPLQSFAGSSKEEWQEWHEAARAKLLELLGAYPKPVDLSPDVAYSIEDRGVVRERVVFDSEEHMSVPCVVLKPVDMPSDKAGAAILCCHGHGSFGKEPVAGNATSPELVANIAELNYNYAEQMAHHGFLTIAPDLRVFGERSDTGSLVGKNKCNTHFLRGLILGVNTLTLNIWDMKCCVDYLETRPEVDPRRIGMMGLSQGGCMTAFTSAVEPRIKAADIIGYVSTWEGSINRGGLCGSQVVPDIFKHLDVPDIAGLIAPRPLLIEMGIHDKCFPIEDQLRGYKRVERIYKAAGAEESLWADVHPGAHAFAANRAVGFFTEHL